MKLPALFAVFVLVLGLGWYWTRAGDGPAPSGLGPGALTMDEPAPEAEDSSLVDLEGDADSEGQEARVEVAGAPQAVPVQQSDDPWADLLGGAIGRVVEEDGTPVADISVALVQADANLMLSMDWSVLGEEPPSLVLEQTTTDDEGRFRLSGAYDMSFQGLGIDLQGPRSTVRVIDNQLHHGEVTDLGDIVLRSGCTVMGRVVDEAGAPQAGVRVRLVPAPPEGADVGVQLGLQDFRSHCSVGISKVIAEGGLTPVIELPGLVRQHLDDLPIPTTMTDQEGRFLFEGAPIGDVLVGVDRLGWLGQMRQETTREGEVELADFILRVGRTVAGRVLDMEGEPVAGAEVIAGCEVFLGEVAFLHPAGLSDADGNFQVAGMPTTGTMMAAARRAADEPWVAVMGATAAELEIELEEAFDLTVRVQDAVGEPVTGARVSISPAGDEDDEMRVLQRFMTLGVPVRNPRFQEVEEGVYLAKDVTPGMYHIEARSSRMATAVVTQDVWSGEPEVLLTCMVGTRLNLQVVDVATGTGVSSARASVVRPEDFIMLRALAVGRTDNEGRVELGPYDSSPPKQSHAWGGPQGLSVLVQHPGYADQTVTLTEGMEILQVALERGGEVRGSIHWGGSHPEKLYMLTLERRKDSGLSEMFSPPRLARSALDGSFRFSNVRPGTYRVQVYERWFDEDPVELLMAQKEPTLVHRGPEFEVEPSVTVERTIDLSPDGGGLTARLVGSIRLDGRPVANASVRVNSTGWSRTTSDVDGLFETDPVLVGEEMRVRIEAEIENEDGSKTDLDLYRDTIPIQPGEVRRLDIDVTSQELVVTVMDASGRPIPDARVSVSRSGGGGSREETDAEGMVRMPITGHGKFTVSAESKGFADGRETIEVQAGSSLEPLTLTLEESLPCAGVADFRSMDYASIQRAAMFVQRDGNNKWVQLKVSDIQDDGLAAFEIDNMGPGEYEVRFWTGSRMTDPITMELPEGGDTNLTVVHP